MGLLSVKTQTSTIGDISVLVEVALQTIVPVEQQRYA